MDQMSQPREFDSEVNTYYRESGKKAYESLIGCVVRFLPRSMMKKNRHQQMTSRSNQGDGVATPAI